MTAGGGVAKRGFALLSYAVIHHSLSAQDCADPVAVMAALDQVAELIAADKEYDEARAMVDDIAGCPFPSDFERLDAATARRASALAAVGEK